MVAGAIFRVVLLTFAVACLYKVIVLKVTPRDMAQLVKCQAHKHTSNPPTHVKSLSEQLPFITSGLGKQRQEDPRRSLASQSSPMDELQVLQEILSQVIRKRAAWVLVPWVILL